MPPRLFPCGTTRREFVWEMGAGFTGLALTSLLDRDGFFARRAAAAESAVPAASPLAPRAPHFATKAKSCIFLMMNGAPSQVDTFDYKPVLEQYAGQSLPADKKFTNSGGRKVGFLTPSFRKFRPGACKGRPRRTPVLRRRMRDRLDTGRWRSHSLRRRRRGTHCRR